MKLLTKFNLVLIVFFGAGGFIISRLAYDFLMNNARDQVLQQAELMLASARSTRDYTSEQIKPHLLQNPDHLTNFLPQTVPAQFIDYVADGASVTIGEPLRGQTVHNASPPPATPAEATAPRAEKK